MISFDYTYFGLIENNRLIHHILCHMFVFLICSSFFATEYVGMALSYGLPLNAFLYYTVYLGSFLENKMVSVERIKQFMNIPSEAAWTKSESPASPNWPNRGEIEIKDLQVRTLQLQHELSKHPGYNISFRFFTSLFCFSRTHSNFPYQSKCCYYLP